jgi:hypothetical protein
VTGEPVDRALDLGQWWVLLIGWIGVPFLPTAGRVEEMNRRRLRVLGGENDPAVADQLLQRRLSLIDGGERSRVLCSTIDQQAHRLVDFDHLQRQAGAQVGTGALHHAEQAGQVVHDLGTAAEVLRC